MTLSSIQSGDCGYTSSGAAGTVLPAVSTVGNCIVLCVIGFNDGTVTSITSPMGTFTQIVSADLSAATGYIVEWWVCLKATGAAQTITAVSSSGGYMAQATEWSGDVSAAVTGGSGAGTSASVGAPVTPLQPGDVILEFAGNNAQAFNSGPSSPWTYFSGVTFALSAAIDVAWQTVTSTTPVTPVWATTSSVSWASLALILSPPYTVTFDANGGSGSMSPEISGSATALTANAFTYSGYTFGHWNTAADNSGTSYADGASYPFTANATLYAIWTANTDVVAFNANGGTGTMASENFTSGAAQALTANAFTQAGYTFNEWNTIAGGGGTAYTNGQSITIYAGMTLYAQWTPNATDTITFNSEGGSAVSNMSGLDGTTITLPSDTRTGYTFDGWFSAATGGVAMTSPYTLAGSVTLYAQWTIIIETVTFDANGGTGTMASEAENYGSAQALTTNTFTRTGHTFNGWNTLANGTGENYANGEIYPFIASVTLYAQWIVPNEGTWTAATPTGPLNSDSVNQFLGLHGVQVVGQGAPVVAISGELTTWQALGDVAQPFIAPANVGWLRVPLTSTDLAPTTEPAWVNAAPVTVSIYTDNAGIPGTLVDSVVIPAEQIETVQLPTWPEPDDLLFGVAVKDAQASLPQLPGGGWAGISTLVAGSWACLFATQGSNDTQMWVSSFDGQDLGVWTAGTTLPVSGIDQVVYAVNAQALVILSGGLLWAASFSQTGVVSSWQTLTLNTGTGSTVTGLGLIGILTYEGSDYLIGVTSSGLSYYATLLSSATVSSWTPGPSMPVGFTSGASFQVGNDLVTVVDSGSALSLVSLSSPGGAWSMNGTLPGASSAVLGMIGDSVITTNGTAIYATALTEFGMAPWTSPVPLSVAGSSVNLVSFYTGAQYVAFWIPTTSGVAGFAQQVYVPSWANVPLPVSLTSGDTYHLVLSASNSLMAGVAVPVVTKGSAIAGLLYNGTSWVSLGGVIPFLALYGSGPPLAMVAAGKTTVMWFDYPSGVLTTVVDLVGGTSNSRVLTYNKNKISQVM
jgi:uncharacterized repeat protein (TIGR02543 family)